MRKGECGDDYDERAETPERDYKAQQEQQMIGPVQDVEEPRLDKPQRRLAPTRVEPDHARIASELEGANNSACRQEPHYSHHAQSQLRKPRVDRKVRRVRINRVLEQYVEQPLVPIKLRIVRQPRASDVR